MSTNPAPASGQTHDAPPTEQRAVVPYESKIVEYNETTKGLAELEGEFKGVVFQVGTRQGMADAQRALTRFVKLRTSLDAKHEEVKRDLLARTKLIDGERRAILALIAPLEKGIRDQVDAEKKRIDDERLAKERAEKERVEAIERAKREAEEAQIKAEREDNLRKARELEEARQKFEAEQKAQREKLEADQRADRERIAKEQADAREKAEAEHRERVRKDEFERTARQEIMGIQHQAIIAQQGRIGVRVGGTIRCIEETLAETEAWEITEEKFGWLTEQAQQVKASTVATIRSMLQTAQRQQEEAARLKAEQDRIAAERAQHEEAQRKARAEQEERERAERESKEAADRKAREEEHARQLEAQRQQEEAERARRQQEEEARAKAEAEERARQKAEQDRLDARGILQAFVDRFGDQPEYGDVVKAIRKFLAPKRGEPS